MSENDAGKEGKAGAWTEATKLQFLLHIIKQFKADGKPINWSRINIPGRTTKSLQNAWTKINKEIAALDGPQVDGEKTTTPRKALPRESPKKRPAFEYESSDDCDNDAMKLSTPKKRGAASDEDTPAKKRKKVKKEETGAELVRPKSEECQI